MEHVQVRATDELDHGTSRECRGASVQTGIVSTNCSYIYMPGGVLGPALAQKMRLLSLFAKVEQTLQL